METKNSPNGVCLYIYYDSSKPNVMDTLANEEDLIKAFNCFNTIRVDNLIIGKRIRKDTWFIDKTNKYQNRNYVDYLVLSNTKNLTYTYSDIERLYNEYE